MGNYLMRRQLIGLLAALLLGLLPATPTLAEEARCTCAPAEPLGNWCRKHRVAWVAGVRLTSWELFEALDTHGHEVDIDLLSCSTCKQAHAGDGFCDEHRFGFVDGMAYFSALTYSLAKGEARQPSTISCPVCRKNSQTHGWCPTHEVGMVGTVELRNEDDYRRAAAAYRRLLQARETAERCEVCAAVTIMDGTCRTHNATYKDGKLVDR